MELLVIALCAWGAAIAVVGSIAAWRDRMIRRFRQLDATSIRDAHEHQIVKLVGVVQLERETLRAPLSGRACAAYEVTVSRRTGESGLPIVQELRVNDFHVDDGTGRALVRAEYARLEIVADHHGAQHSERLHALLERHGVAATNWAGEPLELSYSEGVLEPGERVTVLGRCRREVDPDPNASHGYREPAQRLVLEWSKDALLLVSDDPRARA